ncbi:MAG: WD40 repeat domain-containing protein [Pirellulaceae bacterium]|nr:WD40 repeat domain-containing protein [Pirellulaceae bacterium]
MRRRQFLRQLVAVAAVGLGARSRSARASWASQTLNHPAGAGVSAPVITSLAVHPAGKWVAAAGDDHAISIWRLDEKRLERRLGGHADWVRTVVFSPDGRWLASAGNDRRVQLWDIQSDWREEPLDEPSSNPGQLAFSPDGRWLARVGFDNALRLYDVSRRGFNRTLSCPCVDMRAVAFSPDGGHLAAGGRNGVVRVWNLADGSSLAQQRLHGRRIRSLLFTEGGRELISAGEDGVLRKWDIFGERVDDFPRVSGRILAVTQCGDDRLATGGSDNLIRIWGLAERRQLETLPGHTGSVAALAWNPGCLVSDVASDARHPGCLISGGFDTTLRVWTETRTGSFEVLAPFSD